jgi:hypothetical protein
MELRVALNQRHGEERIRALWSKNNFQEGEGVAEGVSGESSCPSNGAGSYQSDFCWLFCVLPRRSPPRRTRNSDKYIQQGIADGIFYLLQKWPGVNGSGNISARKIGMWAMQIMLDMMMDLMNKIAREEAMILEKDCWRTLTDHDIATAARLILRNCKDAHSCTTMARVEMNSKAYANYRYNKWWDCVCKERAAVSMAAAHSPPPPYPQRLPKSKNTRPTLACKQSEMQARGT